MTASRPTNGPGSGQPSASRQMTFGSWPSAKVSISPALKAANIDLIRSTCSCDIARAVSRGEGEGCPGASRSPGHRAEASRAQRSCSSVPHVVRVDLDEGSGYQLSLQLAEAHRRVTAVQAEQAAMN